MAFIYKLEHPDGTPVDPPTFRSSPATTWNVGDVLYLGSRTMRVIAKRSATEPEDDPVLVVEAA
jgi:hypothetical protein